MPSAATVLFTPRDNPDYDAASYRAVALEGRVNGPLDHLPNSVGALPAVHKSPRSHRALHVVSDAPSSQRNENCAEMRGMSQPTSGRKLPLPNKNEVRDKLAKALAEASPTAKPIARETGASVDTAEGWRAGLNIPGGYNLIVLARQFPEVRAVVRQLIDSDFDADPKAYAMFIEAMRYAQGRAK